MEPYLVRMDGVLFLAWKMNYRHLYSLFGESRVGCLLWEDQNYKYRHVALKHQMGSQHREMGLQCP